ISSWICCLIPIIIDNYLKYIAIGENIDHNELMVPTTYIRHDIFEEVPEELNLFHIIIVRELQDCCSSC
ncbi:MAG: hypothetical protein AABY22_03210, partial [Nanoarchaeota archaeon]